MKRWFVLTLVRCRSRIRRLLLLLKIECATFVYVVQRLVGLVDFLEDFLGSGRRILIGMVLKRFLAIRFPYLVRVRGGLDAEYGIPIVGDHRSGVTVRSSKNDNHFYTSGERKKKKQVI